jgi:hypothetical protein
MKDRGEDEMTVVLKVFAELMQKMREGADKPGSQAPDINLLELLLNPSKLKRIFAEQLVEAGERVDRRLEPKITSRGTE